MASHLVRTAHDYAVAWGFSSAIVLIALSNAFDFALREVIMGWPQGVDKEKGTTARERIASPNALPTNRELRTSVRTWLAVCVARCLI